MPAPLQRAYEVRIEGAQSNSRLTQLTVDQLFKSELRHGPAREAVIAANPRTSEARRLLPPARRPALLRHDVRPPWCSPSPSLSAMTSSAAWMTTSRPSASTATARCAKTSLDIRRRSVKSPGDGTEGRGMRVPPPLPLGSRRSEPPQRSASAVSGDPHSLVPLPSTSSLSSLSYPSAVPIPPLPCAPTSTTDQRGDAREGGGGRSARVRRGGGGECDDQGTVLRGHRRGAPGHRTRAAGAYTRPLFGST